MVVIDRLLKESFALEDQLLEAAWSRETDQGKDENRNKEAESRFGGCLPFDEFVSCCRHFPLKEILNAYGVAGGRGKGLLFKKGQVLGTYPYEELCDRLLALIENN